MSAITIIGRVHEDYTTAWHYATALEHLGRDVQRMIWTHDDTVIVVDGKRVGVEVGRRAGLAERPIPDATDVFFTDDGVWAREHPQYGATDVRYLRAGCHGPEAHDSEAYPPWEPLWDVAFVGSSPGHPEWPHRAELVAHLREWFGDRFLHLGPGGQTVEDDSLNHHASLRGHWLNRLYRSVPLVIGDSLFHDPLEPYWSERCYEVWARGGFLIHPFNNALDAEIDAPLSGWPLGDWAMLRDEIDFWLAHPVMREEQRVRLQEIVRTRCTYEHRVTELLTMIGA